MYSVIYGSYEYGYVPALYPYQYYLSDIFNRLLSRLTSNFKVTVNPDGSYSGPQNWAKLLWLYAFFKQRNENAITTMILLSLLEVARGTWLDRLGLLAGIRRADYGSYEDERFRQVIRVKAYQNGSKGTYADIYNTCTELVDGENYMDISQFTPHSFQVTTDGLVFNESFFYNMVLGAKPDISQFDIVQVVPDSSYPFRLAADGSYYSIFASAGGAATIDIPKADFTPAITAGTFADGTISIYSGTAGGDYRTIDGNGAVDNGLTWQFTVTAAWSIAPDITSELNIMPVLGGMGLAADSIFDIPVDSAAYETIDILKAHFVPPVGAGALPFAQIVVIDGTGTDTVTTVDATGAVDNGLTWTFNVSPMDVIPDGTSRVDILTGGGKLGHSITG
jgi:hypothetical protein